MPTFNLLYFKSLLDEALVDFFNKFNAKFISENGCYFLSNDISKIKIQQLLMSSIVKNIRSIITDYDILNPNYYLILGSCYPKDNLLLKYKDLNYFPEKLNKLICSKYTIKYLLREKDIKIDIVSFNQIMNNIFNLLFTETYKFKEKNIIFITNQSLDSYLLFKTIKGIYGNKNCKNLYNEHFINKKQPFVSINNLIDQYTQKSKVKDDIQFIRCQQEIKIYLKSKIGF